jgi:hypothetical protein
MQKLEEKLMIAEKELQQVRKDNQALDCDINAKWKKEEVRKKVVEEVDKKAK